MIKTEREFTKLCISRGFARLAPRFYARCIGDGIYQTIYTGFKKFLDPSSLNYSRDNIQSYYISIDIHSIYSSYDESIFEPGGNSGGFRPADLRDGCKSVHIFAGIDEEYTIMETVGFDILDSIDTQEAYISWWNKVKTIDDGYRIHALQLAVPFLMCGQRHEAEYEISVSFIHRMDAYMDYLERVESGLLKSEEVYEYRVRAGIAKEITLWRWCMGLNRESLDAYIHENYCTNMSYMSKYSIPVIRHTERKLLPETK